MVGKVEAGIPEDDPRNPATIADNVGDNVGDCAGMAADLFETYVVTAVATMVLAAIVLPDAFKLAGMILPLAIGGACVVTSIIGTYFVRLGASNNIMGALYKGIVATGVLSLIVLLPVLGWVFGDLNAALGIEGGKAFTPWQLFWCGVTGLVITGAHHRHHRILHRHRQAPGQLDRRSLDHRARHQRHPGPRRLARGDGAAGAGDHRRHHRHLQPRRACSASRSPSPRCWRSPAWWWRSTPSGRSPTMPAASPKWPGLDQGSAPQYRRARRRRQHHQGRDQGLCHRFGRARRAGAVRGLYAGPQLLRRARDGRVDSSTGWGRSPSRSPIPTSWSGCCSAACCRSSSAACR